MPAASLSFLKIFRKVGGKGVSGRGWASESSAKLSNDMSRKPGNAGMHFIPPYAPDLNPTEFVWQYAKTNGIAKKPLSKTNPCGSGRDGFGGHQSTRHSFGHSLKPQV